MNSEKNKKKKERPNRHDDQKIISNRMNKRWIDWLAGLVNNEDNMQNQSEEKCSSFVCVCFLNRINVQKEEEENPKWFENQINIFYRKKNDHAVVIINFFKQWLNECETFDRSNEYWIDLAKHSDVSCAKNHSMMTTTKSNSNFRKEKRSDMNKNRK